MSVNYSPDIRLFRGRWEKWKAQNKWSADIGKSLANIFGDVDKRLQKAMQTLVGSDFSKEDQDSLIESIAYKNSRERLISIQNTRWNHHLVGYSIFSRGIWGFLCFITVLMAGKMVIEAPQDFIDPNVIIPFSIIGLIAAFFAYKASMLSKNIESLKSSMTEANELIDIFKYEISLAANKA